jgi:FkbH-like protein
MEARRIKCLAWDLDDTLWTGVLLEGGGASLKPGVADAIRMLDERGILQSIASRNDATAAQERLRALGVEDMFIHPQIGWGAKSEALDTLRAELNIGFEALAFIDDQPYERAEVAFSHPEVLCLSPEDLPSLGGRVEFQPRFVTEDSRRRRMLYRVDMKRKAEEAEFSGPKEEFLATLNMAFTIRPARKEDLQRAEELTQRTHQLNTTGQTYDYHELEALAGSDRHLLLVAELEDRFGPYGTVGLALVECDEAWTIKLLLMSCRVAARGVGTVLLHFIMRLARDRGRTLRAEFRSNGRNEMMRMTYGFAGFREVARKGGLQLLEASPDRPVPSPPSYLELRARNPI